MSEYMLSIEGKVVIVTGGASIGRVYCRELAKAGCKVVAADIDDAANADTVAEIGMQAATRLPQRQMFPTKRPLRKWR